jgi:hypothetical protein
MRVPRAVAITDALTSLHNPVFVLERTAIVVVVPDELVDGDEHDVATRARPTAATTHR